MISFKIIITPSHRIVQDSINRYHISLGEALSRGRERVRRIGKSYMEKFCPVGRTGNLRNAIRSRTISKYGMEIYIDEKIAPYAKYVIEGRTGGQFYSRRGGKPYCKREVGITPSGKRAYSPCYGGKGEVFYSFTMGKMDPNDFVSRSAEEVRRQLSGIYIDELTKIKVK